MNQSTHKTFKLSPQKRSLFDALLSKEGVRLASLPPIARRGSASNGVLSFAQERLWFLDQLEPNKSLYNIPSAKRLAGRLDVAALEHSLSEIVRRHESLRTNFVSTDGEPLLKISAPASFHLPLSDFSALPEVERLNEAQRWARRQAEQPFDLAKDNLL